MALMHIFIAEIENKRGKKKLTKVRPDIIEKRFIHAYSRCSEHVCVNGCSVHTSMLRARLSIRLLRVHFGAPSMTE